MGSQCTTPKTKGIIHSRKTAKATVSPVSAQKVAEKGLSFSEQNKLLQSKVPSWESLPNIESLETLSIRSKSMTTEVVCEDSPKLVTISSPTTLNSLPIPDNTDMKKSSPYKKGPSIGKGCYGEVHECLNLSSGELHAAKSVKAYGESRRLQNYIEAFKKEIVVLQGLSHTNVVKYFAMEISEFKEENYTTIDIISEYVSGGSIKVLLDKFDKLDERVASHYTKQILEGLAYLHSNEIVHRNIKSSNILIDSCGTAKLADFGCFKSLEKFVNFNSPDKNSKNYSPKTRFCWHAPEVLMKKSQGKSSDIWSVGCVLLEMLTGTLPWKHANMSLDEVYKLIMSGGLPSFPENISENCRDFLSKAFKFRPEDRPTALELLDHSFIRETIPSLSCLDYDSITQTFQIHQTLMGHNSIDEIFAGAKRIQENNHIPAQDPSFGNLQTGGPATLKKINELTIHVGQSKTIPNHLNKPAPSLPGLVKLGSRTSIEDNSFCKNNWETARTPGRRKEFDPEFGGNNSLSTASKTLVSEETARFGSQTSIIIHTPIKNTFFFSPNPHAKEHHQSARRIENSSSFAIQASLNKTRNVGSVILEKDKDQNASPMAQERLRKMFEEKMQEELARIDLEEDNSMENKQQSEDKQNKSQEDLEQEKAEMRRKYEQEMERELNGLEVSNFDR